MDGQLDGWTERKEASDAKDRCERQADRSSAEHLLYQNKCVCVCERDKERERERERVMNGLVCTASSVQGGGEGGEVRRDTRMG